MAPRLRDFELRVATGSNDGQVSSVIWRIWKSRNTDDVYIAARSFSSQIKCAMHASGWSYFGFTDSYAQDLRQRGHELKKGRAWTHWKRPVIPPTGYSIVAQIWFLPGPFDGTLPPGKLVCLLPPPRVGQAAVVYIIISNVKHLQIPHNTTHLQSCEMSNGKYLAIFARLESFNFKEFTDRHTPLLESAKTNWRFLEGALSDFNADDKYRMLMFNEPNEEENVVKFIDIPIQVLSASSTGAVIRLPDQ